MFVYTNNQLKQWCLRCSLNIIYTFNTWLVLLELQTLTNNKIFSFLNNLHYLFLVSFKRIWSFVDIPLLTQPSYFQHNLTYFCVNAVFSFFFLVCSSPSFLKKLIVFSLCSSNFLFKLLNLFVSNFYISFPHNFTDLNRYLFVFNFPIVS